MRFRVVFFWVIVSLCALKAGAQEDLKAFREGQFASKRVLEAWRRYSDTLTREFKKKGLTFPSKNLYIRAFKSQNELELWARNEESGEYKLVKTYRICSLSGALGPKRTEGDRQVPEGFYFIEAFNAVSDYFLSLKISYPNYVDRMKGRGPLGGEIYLHGGCVTVGCLPMTDEGIRELYTACLGARLSGQENLPVHIFPTRLTANGIAYLKKEFPKDAARQQFWADLRGGFEYFEKFRKLLPVMYSPEGRYVY